MKQSSKKNFKSVVSILLMLAVVITGAFAYFSATDSKTNVFTIGSVDIELVEDGWVQDQDGNYVREDGTNVNILPGLAIEKAPYVKNTGRNEAWAFVTVGIPTVVKPAANGELKSYGANLDVPVVAYAVQDGYNNATGDAEAIWNEFFAGKAAEKFGAESTKTVTELFSIDELDTTNWTQIGDAYNSEDGYMYYVFAYNTMIDPDASTEKLFTSVTLDSTLVGTDAVSNTLVQNNMYYSDKEIDPDKLTSIFGSNPSYGGPIPTPVTSNNGDKFATDTGYVAEHDGTEWVVNDTYDDELAKEHPVPEEILGVPARNNVAYMSKVEGSTGIIDNFYIYGLQRNLTPAKFFKDYFELTGLEYEVTYTATTNRYLGTGSVVTLKYPGNVTQNYTIIIFGDVDGDCLINGRDVTALTNYLKAPDESPLTDAQMYAADVTRDGIVDDADAEKIRLAANSGANGYLNQVDPSGPLVF